MSTLAIEISAVGLLGRTAGGGAFDSPGFAIVDGSVTTGAAAMSQARLQPGRVFSHFWEALSLETLPQTVRGANTTADLAFHHLQDVWTAMDPKPEQVILVIPGSYSSEQLSLLLGIARECKMPVTAIIDMAVAAAGRPVPGRQLLHVEPMLHSIVLTRLNQGQRLRRDKIATVAGSGLLDFQDKWAQPVSDAFVRNTRYDPMHSAAAEQQFYDRLPGWVATADRDGSVDAAVDRADKELRVTIKREVLVEAGAPLLRPIMRQLSALTQPDERLTLLLSDRLHSIPGLSEALTDSGAELIHVPRGAAASGALNRAAEFVSDGESVNFVTSLKWEAYAAAALRPPGTPRPGQVSLPSHVVYGDRAWRLGEGALYFGSEPQESVRSVTLAGDTDGVSRRHCSIERNGREVRVHDHSRFGTFVNDRRVDGEATVHSGDIIRLGSSAQILQLVAEQADGA